MNKLICVGLLEIGKGGGRAHPPLAERQMGDSRWN